MTLFSSLGPSSMRPTSFRATPLSSSSVTKDQKRNSTHAPRDLINNLEKCCREKTRERVPALRISVPQVFVSSSALSTPIVVDLGLLCEIRESCFSVLICIAGIQIFSELCTFFQWMRQKKSAGVSGPLPIFPGLKTRLSPIISVMY